MRNCWQIDPMRPPDSSKVLCESKLLARLEHSYVTTNILEAPGGNGGMGQPSATSVPGLIEEAPGGNGGIGQPSATSVPALIEEAPGGNGGMGQPSAIKVRSIVMSLPAERLTDRTTGSTIEMAKARTATAIAVFFKGVFLLESRMRRNSFGGPQCLKMFRMRNAGRYENAYTTPAKPQSHSGLHPDDACRDSRAICAPGLHGFLAGSLQRQVRARRPCRAVPGRSHPADFAALS